MIAYTSITGGNFTMSKKSIPYPLFDNMDSLMGPLSAWHSRYLPTLGDKVAQEYRLGVRFLLSYQGSLDTFTSYRREIERLCQWAWVYKKQALHTIERDDIAEYLRFVQDPPKHWVGHKHAQRFVVGEEGERIPSPDWRPFLQRKDKSGESREEKAPMQQASLRAVIASVSTFYTYLLQEGYVQKNPVILLRQKSQIIQKRQQSRITRKLTRNQWETMITQVARKADQDSHFERHLFALSAFYLLGVRISELAETPGRVPLMRDFTRDHDGLWWFNTVGKGNKLREVAVPDAMMDTLGRFRQFLGLQRLPSPGEGTALMPKQRGVGGIGVRQLRKTVQEAFELAIDTLERQGEVEEACHMRHATVHWLRHTAISYDVTHRPREHVRDDAGHQSIQITDRYIDVDTKARHQSAKSKTLLDVQEENA